MNVVGFKRDQLGKPRAWQEPIENCPPERWWQFRRRLSLQTGMESTMGTQPGGGTPSTGNPHPIDPAVEGPKPLGADRHFWSQGMASISAKAVRNNVLQQRPRSASREGIATEYIDRVRRYVGLAIRIIEVPRPRESNCSKTVLLAARIVPGN